MVNKIVETHQLANQLMQEHGLIDKGWHFDLDATKTSVGRCHYDKKRISFSMHFLEKTPMEQVKDTILHEIAHALAGYEAGHGHEWKQIAREVGARPVRCADKTAKSTAKYNYVMRCENPNCRVQPKWYRYRMRQRNFQALCPHCKTPIAIYHIKRG